MLRVLIASFIAFSGLFFGMLLAQIAPDEVKPGKKYFSILQYALSTAIAIVLLYNVINSQEQYLAIVASFAVGIILAVLFKIKYLYLGIGLFSSALTKDVFALLASLIFIYGLPAGTLLARKKIKLISTSMLAFAIPSMALFMPLFNNYLAAFAAGALLGRK